MKTLKILLVFLVLLVNLVVAKPSLADRPQFTKSNEYQQVTQALNDILKIQSDPNQTDYKPEQLQQKIGGLQLQKYILETARNWSLCSNKTGSTLAVYAHKPKKSFFPNANESTLFYLADGEVTDDEWNCDGVYLPAGAKVGGLVAGNPQGQELAEPLALKLVPGSQLIATSNPDTGAIELNIPPLQVFKAGETSWQIPTLSQADIDATSPDAPVD